MATSVGAGAALLSRGWSALDSAARRRRPVAMSAIVDRRMSTVGTDLLRGTPVATWRISGTVHAAHIAGPMTLSSLIGDLAEEPVFVGERDQL